MRTRQMWIENILALARQNGGLALASDTPNDSYRAMTTGEGQALEKRGLMRMIGRDEHGRQVYVLNEEEK